MIDKKKVKGRHNINHKYKIMLFLALSRRQGLTVRTAVMPEFTDLDMDLIDAELKFQE